ncbi:hypothetical protein GW756_01675 [bacterium]|nr:hypothetical protein [bacterium]NCQ55064.1 hypothetical protein [Candidatus Parcubacteria bacterium]NCS67108.1 hypothetical protein [Candidatus Peregrinibacteria bacterium]NCS96054.1 hypothetical protein [bacterium]
MGSEQPPQTLEEEVEAYRKKGFEAEIVNGEIHVTLGRKRSKEVVETTGANVSMVLAPSGLPAVKKGVLLHPGTLVFDETVRSMKGRS